MRTKHISLHPCRGAPQMLPPDAIELLAECVLCSRQNCGRSDTIGSVEARQRTEMPFSGKSTWMWPTGLKDKFLGKSVSQCFARAFGCLGSSGNSVPCSERPESFSRGSFACNHCQDLPSGCSQANINKIGGGSPAHVPMKAMKLESLKSRERQARSKEVELESSKRIKRRKKHFAVRVPPNGMVDRRCNGHMK